MFLNLKCLIQEFDLLQVIFKNNSSFGYNGYIFTKKNFAHERGFTLKPTTRTKSNHFAERMAHVFSLLFFKKMTTKLLFFL